MRFAKSKVQLFTLIALLTSTLTLTTHYVNQMQDGGDNHYVSKTSEDKSTEKLKRTDKVKSVYNKDMLSELSHNKYSKDNLVYNSGKEVEYTSESKGEPEDLGLKVTTESSLLENDISSRYSTNSTRAKEVANNYGDKSAVAEHFKYNNKKLAVIGDSITYHDKQDKLGIGIVKGYPSILEENLGFSKSINLSISGGTIAKIDERKDKGISDRFISYEYSDVEYVIIAGGTNDFRLDVPIGELNSININTFYGAYNNMLYSMKKSNPKLKIMLWSPLVRNNSNYSSETKNLKDLYLSDYVYAVKHLAEKHGVSYCDMYNYSGLTLENLSEFTVDGLHLNNKGYELISEQAIKCIKSQDW